MGLVLALLAAVTDGDSFERADAVHALLRWRTGDRGGIHESSVALYIAGLKVMEIYREKVTRRAQGSLSKSLQCKRATPANTCTALQPVSAHHC